MTRRNALACALALVLGSGPLLAGAPAKVLLDSDGYADYDDVVALMAAAASPEVEIVGAVATGRDAARRARTIAKALAIMGKDDVPVCVGEASLSPEPDFPYMSQFPRRGYGLRPELERWADEFAAPLCGSGGAEFELQTMARFPGQVTVIVTGPLSTIGRALQLADQRGDGARFRQSIRQILFSGGDFDTVEYNVYTDVGATRLVLDSGVTIYQFAGEGEGKAFLTREARERLWSARTPATWALQDLYRLYRAGWDPRSPFVPILYDVHPVAFLIAGEAIDRFEPARLGVDAVGHLTRSPGAPNGFVRVESRGDRLIQWVGDRLSDVRQPGVNHLRRLLSGAEPPGGEIAAEAAALVERLQDGREIDREGMAHALGSLAAKLARQEERGATALRHLELARGFLLGEVRDHPWRDPYSPLVVAVIIFGNRAYSLVTHPWFMALGLAGLGAIAAGLFIMRLRRARRPAAG